MKIFVFGIGQYFQNRKEQFWEIVSDDEVIGFLDSRADQVGDCEGVPVVLPSAALEYSFDKIILMSTKCPEILDQLVSLGISRKKVLFWEQYRAQKTRGNINLQINTVPTKKSAVLLITTDLGYNGGSIAAIYAAIALERKGYYVLLVSPSCDKKFYREIMKNKINLLIYPTLPYVTNLERVGIEKFDFVIVNVLQMIKVACDISQYKPVLWWIHEPDDKSDSFYGYIRSQFSEYNDISSMEKVAVYAVSGIAKNAFDRYYPHQVSHILPCGIPDESHGIANDDQYDKFVFAIIGAVCPLKSQIIFLEVANRLPQEIREMCEFWVIGSCGPDSYGNKVQGMIRSIPQARFVGVLGRSELRNAFRRIDCVVCASLLETMSLTITEGLMYGKICIATDHTGIAEYIKDDINGFVCKAGDVTSLHSCMKKAFDIRDKSSELRKRARQLYEDEFSMERFGERLAYELEETKKRYHNL